MTNLMEHSTCILDISSDEESSRAKRYDRGKENIAPADDVSQTSQSSASRSRESDFKELRKRKVADGACDVDRSPLGEMKIEEYFAEGCNKASVVLVEEDEAPEPSVKSKIPTFELSTPTEVEGLMKKDGPAPKARVLEPIVKAEEGFEVWESGSAHGDE